ncbi:hypothetical protein [Mesorhizobium sp. M0678]|uniref:hypothetical protein n=1 Tax=Mesorhizobium sp. M0678 TaxID=2956985 RepID=UPI00333DBAEA
MTDMKKENWPLVSFRLHPDTCHAVAQAMRRQGIKSRPEWLIAAITRELAEQAAQ